MFARGIPRFRFGRSFALVVATVSCAAASAAGASGATLTIGLTPSAIHAHHAFQISIAGTFRRKKTFLLAFIQYSGKQCKTNPTGELSRTSNTGGAYDVGTLKVSPFHRVRNFTAGRAGLRRVCAYLLPKRVKPGAHVQALKRADVTYQVLP